jgi:hypothetical protein
MMLMTVDIPNELAVRLQPFLQFMPQVLELGLPEFSTHPRLMMFLPSQCGQQILSVQCNCRVAS